MRAEQLSEGLLRDRPVVPLEVDLAMLRLVRVRARVRVSNRARVRGRVRVSNRARVRVRVRVSKRARVRARAGLG